MVPFRTAQFALKSPIQLAYGANTKKKNRKNSTTEQPQKNICFGSKQHILAAIPFIYTELWDFRIYPSRKGAPLR